MSALAGTAYLILLVWHVPLPMAVESHHGFELHVAGMAVNFLITAMLLGFFINRLARALRAQQVEVQRIRERALRDEGILAIATQAAGAAHEMNTPLSTMRTLLPELRHEHAGDLPLSEDLALLEGQVERCRDDPPRDGGVRQGAAVADTGTAQRGAIHPRLPGAFPAAASGSRTRIDAG